MTVPTFDAHAVTHLGVARVTLAGELDLDTAPCVWRAVVACLAEQPKSLCLDLTHVCFCDCAGVNALLDARRFILRAGVDLVVEGIGSQLARLLDLIGAGDVLTEGHVAAATVPARLG
ncbi:STAS domain-containing protein [Streptomyces sp. MS1.AVA.3]|uniref:STAS domain-containing protein n=1 Tax=Streptomyces decoyicus TaxID=249567 RepID=UPI0030C3EEEE